MSCVARLVCVSCVGMAPGWFIPQRLPAEVGALPGPCGLLDTACKADFGQYLTVVNRKQDVQAVALSCLCCQGWSVHWLTWAVSQEGMSKDGG